MDKRGAQVALAALFIAALLFRLPGALLPPTEMVYEPVEMKTVVSTVGLFAGLTPQGFTIWSSGIIGLPLMVVYSLMFFLSHPQSLLSLLHRDLGAFFNSLSFYIAEAVAHPSNHLVVGRVLVAIVSSLAPAALFWFLRKKGKGTGGIFSAVLLLSAPYFVAQSYNLLTDALGAAFFTLALVSLLGQEHIDGRVAFRSGVLYGLALAGKFLYISFLPAAALALYFGCRKGLRMSNTFKAFCFFACGTALSVMVFIPYVWINPLTLIKNILGVCALTFMGGHTSWQILLFTSIPSYVGWPGAVLAAAGIFLSFSVLGKRIASVLLFGFLLFLIPLGNSNSILDRYTLPLASFLCLYAGVTLQFFIGRRSPRAPKKLIIALAIFFLALNSWQVAQDLQRTHGRSNLAECGKWVEGNIPAGTTVAIGGELMMYLSPSIPALERWVGGSEEDVYARLEPLFAKGSMRYAGSNKGNPLIPAVFAANERQKLFLAKLQLWQAKNGSSKAPAYDLYPYTTEIMTPDPSTLTVGQAVSLYMAHIIDVYVGAKNAALPAAELCAQFESHRGQKFYIYKHSSS